MFTKGRRLLHSKNYFKTHSYPLFSHPAMAIYLIFNPLTVVRPK